MTWIALSLAVGLSVSIIALAGLLRSSFREHARRENLLVNQLLHAMNMSWEPAPAEAIPEPETTWEEREARAMELRARFQVVPEQWPEPDGSGGEAV